MDRGVANNSPLFFSYEKDWYFSWRHIWINIWWYSTFNERYWSLCRKCKDWTDYNLFGHQLVLHHDKSHTAKKHHNEVDGKSVPVPHFGVVLPWNQFNKFSKRLIDKGLEFVIEPHIRFKGLPGEQMTMFFYDPSGNAIEFKSFKNINQLFEKEWRF